MQINNFSGGLDRRVDPTLASPNTALIYTNIDNYSGPLKSEKGIALLDKSVENFIYKFNNVWISSKNKRTYVEYDSVLYYTEQGAKARKSADGVIFTNLGIQSPPELPLFLADGITPVVDSAGNQIKSIRATPTSPAGVETPITSTDITVQYTYTYYNSTEGIESAPAPLGNEVAVSAGQVVVLDNFLFSSDPQVTHIRIYRIGLNTEFMLVKEVENNVSTTRDFTPNEELTSILDSTNNNAPIVGLGNLTEAYGILFGSYSNKLYFSIIGKPNYWPSSNVFILPHDITGILAIQEGIFIFTATKTYMLLGTSNDTFSLIKVSNEQGCIAGTSCAMVKNAPIWCSMDGYCTWANGSVIVLSKEKLGKFTPSVVSAAVWDETYWVLDTSGDLTAVDFRVSLSIKKYDTAGIQDLCAVDGLLYCSTESKLGQLLAGDLLELKWLSPTFTEGSATQIKSYNNIYVSYKGEFELSIYIDDRLVATHTLDSQNYTVADITPPQDLQRGYTIQFYIVGKGIVREIEYKTVGRQNGR